MFGTCTALLKHPDFSKDAADAFFRSRNMYPTESLIHMTVLSKKFYGRQSVFRMTICNRVVHHEVNVRCTLYRH